MDEVGGYEHGGDSGGEGRSGQAGSGGGPVGERGGGAAGAGSCGESGGEGPHKARVNIPRLLQSAFITDFNKYSALSVLDRETLNRLLAETLDPIYRDNLAIVRLGHITQTDYIITGTIIKTNAGSVMSLHIANTQDGTINASHTETYTLEGLENLTGIHQATAALLPALGVILTDRAKRELTGPATTRR